MSKVIEEAEAKPNERNLHHLVVLFNLTEQGLGDLTLTLGDTALAGAEVTVLALMQSLGRRLSTGNFKPYPARHCWRLPCFQKSPITRTGSDKPVAC
jgi:hypothetical protein